MDKSGTVCSVTSFDNLNDSKVRFLIESKVRVFPTEERWLLRGLKSKSQTEQFHVSGTGSKTIGHIGHIGVKGPLLVLIDR